MAARLCISGLIARERPSDFWRGAPGKGKLMTPRPRGEASQFRLHLGKGPSPRVELEGNRRVFMGRAVIKGRQKAKQTMATWGACGPAHLTGTDGSARPAK